MKNHLKILILVACLLPIFLACQAISNVPKAVQSPTPVAILPTNAPVNLPAIVTDYSGFQDTLISLYERLSPGVVSIRVFAGEDGGLGSGFVLDKEGHILTNYHVVQGMTNLEVDFPSGYKVRGEIIGTDPDSDFAVIKVDVPPEELTPLPLGDSEQVKVGQTVIAIGNPFGLNGTMTVGIVSGVGRTLDSMRETGGGDFYGAGGIIQTDTAINPGNSGGPLINLNGEVIGINRSIRTETFTTNGDPLNSGISFAISINIAKRVIPSLISTGVYNYPYLGITSTNEIGLLEQEALNLPRATGVYVLSVTPGGPADSAGILSGSQETRIHGLNAGGDLIVAVDGHELKTFADLLGYLFAYKSPGDTIILTIIRGNEQMEVPLTLGKRP